MGEGRQDDRVDPTQTYATTIGGALALFGLVGFFYSSSFASGEALVAEKAFGLFYVNGWQNLLHLAAGLAGIALAPLAPRFYCLVSAVAWTVLAAGGFFGAHGGEAVPSMAGLIPAGTANNVFCLLLGGLAFAALAAAGSASTSRSRSHSKAEKPAKSKVKVEPEINPWKGSEKADRDGSEREGSSVGRPRSANRPRSARGPIN